MLFQTARTIVRQLRADDVDALLAVYGDAEAMTWVGDGLPLDRDQCRAWVEVTDRNYATRGYGMAAVTDRTTSEVVGFCGLVHPGGQPEAELKYALARGWWGRGLATEAAIGLLAYGADTHGLTEVIATAHPENVASHRVLSKAGMDRRTICRNDDGTETWVFAWRPAGR